MTPIDPPPGLLDKVAERVRDELKRRTFPPDPITGLGGMGLTEHDIARAAWDAVVEGLGLTEDRRVLLTGWPADPISECRLVSRWEPRP